MGSSVSTDLASVAQVPFTVLTETGLDAPLWPEQAVLQDNASYDYIVVGGGTAGCVVARRLAEDKNRSVLVLEDGGNPPISSMLFSLFFLLPHSFVDYNYTSTRDDYAAGGQNNFTMLTAGKMLGGSASLNHAVHTRGIPSDFDHWAKIVKDKSWQYDNVLEYFKKSERLDDTETLTKYPEFHGTDGPMGLSRSPEKEVIDLLKAFAEAENPTVLDLNANITVGYTQPQFMFADKIRQTPAFTYLNPIKDYSNFYVSKHTRVTRIIFDGNNTAVGVEAVHKGKTYTFRAKREVIICAGVFNTPQLLMLSGIGPKEHLESFNITVLKDAPVGDNLVDQVAISVVHKLKKHLLPIPNLLPAAVDLTRVPFPVLTGIVPLNKTETIPDYQTFNLFFSHDLPYLTIACAQVFGLRADICDRWTKEAIGRDTLYNFIALLQPKSRGTVRLGSTDPFADPIITTGYYTNKDDLKKMVKILKDYLTVEESEYFKEVDAELAGLDLPECAGKEKGTDEYWECYILQHSGTGYHSSCTCPMGTVLDGKLRVKGVNNLRVVDASAMPTIPHGAPNAAIIMLAERASDMIKNADVNN